MENIVTYTSALSHLYGLVHLNQIVEIYNQQNSTSLNLEKAKTIIRENEQELKKCFIYLYEDYAVHESVLQEETFDESLVNQKTKPFYIPEQNELLNYADEFYLDETKEYKKLKNYLRVNVFNGDTFKAEMLSEDIQGYCQYGFSWENIVKEFVRRKVIFDNQKQFDEVSRLIMQLANNTRLRENNGFTPNEVGQKIEKPNFMLPPKPNFVKPSAEKIGRNDPCPCGSGKKYKKCCMNKIQI